MAKKKPIKAYVVFYTWEDSPRQFMGISGNIKMVEQQIDDHFKKRYLGTLEQTAGYRMIKKGKIYNIHYEIVDKNGQTTIKPLTDFYEIEEFTL